MLRTNLTKGTTQAITERYKMTKRKKQIDIVGFTKASNLLPKDKKIDSKITPSKQNATQEASTQLILDDTMIEDQPDSQKLTQIEDGNIKLNDTDFFNSTIDPNDSILIKENAQNKDTSMIQTEEIPKERQTKSDTTNRSLNSSKESYASKAKASYTLGSPTPEKQKKKVYGSTNWCAAQMLCKNRETPSTYDHWCRQCQFSGHFECVIINSDNISAECICLKCHSTQDTNIIQFSNQSLMQNDASAILKDDSFDTFDLNNIVDETTLNNSTDIHTSPKDIQQAIYQITKLKSSTNFPDNVLHAIALSMGANINPEHFSNDKMSTFIVRHQIWLSRQENMEKYFTSNYYKILHKVMGGTNKDKQSFKKTHDMKVATLSEFMRLKQFQHKKLKHILHLTKMNGIYLCEDSFNIEGRELILELLNEASPPRNIIQDDYSKNILEQFLKEHNKHQKPNDTDSSSKIITESHIAFQDILKPTIQQLEDGSRFDIRLNIPPNSDIPTLRSHLQQIVNKITEIDNSVAFVPWFESNSADNMPFNVVPESIWEINKYFPRIKNNPSGIAYGEFRMIHTKSHHHIINELTNWLFENKHAIYYQALQSKLTTNLGWFLWSFRNIDIQTLQQEIYNLYNIRVQLRYQNIAIHKQTKNTEPIKALHIVVNKEYADKISLILQQIYSFEVTKFPLDIIMRFIPHISKVSIKRETTLSKWRDKQRLYLESIQDPSRPMMTRTWEIQDLDGIQHNQISLRKLLMEAKSIEFPSEYLFLSVDISYFRKHEVNFTFLPRHETEARGFVTNIIPYTRHKYPDYQIEKVFLQEAIDRNKDSIWNADTNEIVSSADIYLEQSSNIIENFNMIEALGILSTDPKHYPTTKEHEKVQQLFLGDDNTSVGTLFTNVNNDSILGGNQQRQIITPSSNTVRSQGTTLTIEEVDNKLNSLTSDMQKLHQLIYTLIDNHNTSTTPITTKTNTSQVAGDPMEATCEES